MTGLLSFPHWLLAWDSYCLAAAMLDQFPLSTGITYKHDVANIANDHAAIEMLGQMTGTEETVAGPGHALGAKPKLFLWSPQQLELLRNPEEESEALSDAVPE